MKTGVVASLSLIAAAAALLLSASAFAASTETGAKTPAPAVAAAPVGVLSQSSVNKLANVTPDQQDAIVKQAAEKLKRMTPKERQDFFAANRRRFDALSPAQKKEATVKMKAASDAYIASHKAEWAKNAAIEKKIDDEKSREFLEKMPGIERAVLQKYKELRKTHSKDYAWHMILEDASKGGHLEPIP